MDGIVPGADHRIVVAGQSGRVLRLAIVDRQGKPGVASLETLTVAAQVEEMHRDAHFAHGLGFGDDHIAAPARRIDGQENQHLFAPVPPGAFLDQGLTLRKNLDPGPDAL